MFSGNGRLIAVLASICFVAGVALAAVYEVTKEPIAYQVKLEVIKSLKAVLPSMEIDPDSQFVELERPGFGQTKVFRASTDNVVDAVAFLVTAPDGYSGNISIMMGVLPDGTLGGIEILTHAETPGLGSRIIEDDFKGQFKGRSLDDTNFKVKKDGGDIDQITGATISPRAVAGAVEKGLEWFRDDREKILAPAPTSPQAAGQSSEEVAGTSDKRSTR